MATLGRNTGVGGRTEHWSNAHCTCLSKIKVTYDPQPGSRKKGTERNWSISLPYPFHRANPLLGRCRICRGPNEKLVATASEDRIINAVSQPALALGIILVFNHASFARSKKLRSSTASPNHFSASWLRVRGISLSQLYPAPSLSSLLLNRR